MFGSIFSLEYETIELTVPAIFHHYFLSGELICITQRAVAGAEPPQSLQVQVHWLNR